jgi:predicted DNA-binding protein
MKRTTIMLPDELKTKALKRARNVGKSLAELIRESLEQALARTEPKGADPFIADSAKAKFRGPRDLAKNHDRYLYGERD